MDAIPTKYKGIQFRSRLEATWAAFFDALNWKWQYEPCDMAGWIPDFAIKCLDGKPLYVEVKPTFEFMPGVARKMSRAAPGSKLLLVGFAPWVGDYVYVGWVNNDFDEDEVLSTDIPYQAEVESFCPAPMGIWHGYKNDYRNPEELIGFCNEQISYTDRITGCYDGGYCGDASVEEPVMEAWAAAKNRNQWRRAVRKRHSRIKTDWSHTYWGR
jgi:hypothetical protein